MVIKMPKNMGLDVFVGTKITNDTNKIVERVAEKYGCSKAIALRAVLEAGVKTHVEDLDIEVMVHEDVANYIRKQLSY